MFTTQEAARALQLTSRNLLAFAKSRGIKPARRFGRSVVWSKANIQALKAKRDGLYRRGQ